MSKMDMMKAPGQQPKNGFKRFLKLGSKAKPSKQLLTPPSSLSASPASSRTPTSESCCIDDPPSIFGSLEERYGKAGKTLGDGATGTVKVHTNPTDGTVVAVKTFRRERPSVAEDAFAKKITAEYNIASSLKHGNIIKVLEIAKERGTWYQVAEYAPIELYEVSETRTMSMEEICCAWAQILEGASYLHKMGIAHRDLSLENVVMTDNGIMKIIDFGSATVFRQQSSAKIVLTRGEVGCEPYMAPEVFTGNQYDPRAVDVWSLAIIFCRLVLGRFPWEIAQVCDPSYKSFSKQTSTCTSMDEFARNPMEGPASLLKDLPNESRITIKGMLQVTPSRRLSLRQVMQHPFFKLISVCSEDCDGKVTRGKGHEHMASDTLTPATSRMSE